MTLLSETAKLPIIFIPGMMCDGRLFAPQMEALAGYPMSVADLSKHDSIEAMAESILYTAPPRFHLVGLSMGGIVAMEIMRVAAARIARLALMDTNPLAELDEVKTRRDKQIERVNRIGLRAVMRDEMKPLYVKDTGTDTGADTNTNTDKKPLLDICMDMAEGLGEEVFIRQSRALQNRRDYRETLRGYNGHTLVLHGEDDRLCPAEKHLLMCELLPNARYVCIKEAGHLPTLEQPEAVSIELKKLVNLDEPIG